MPFSTSFPQLPNLTETLAFPFLERQVVHTWFPPHKLIINATLEKISAPEEDLRSVQLQGFQLSDAVSFQPVSDGVQIHTAFHMLALIISLVIGCVTIDINHG